MPSATVRVTGFAAARLRHSLAQLAQHPNAKSRATCNKHAGKL
jgi:hypothetical protein